MSNLNLCTAFMQNLLKDFIKWLTKLFDKVHRQLCWEKFKLSCTIIITLVLVFVTCIFGYMFGLVCFVDCHQINLQHNDTESYSEITECMENNFEDDPGTSILITLFGTLFVILIFIIFIIVVMGLIIFSQYLFKKTIKIKEYFKTKWAQSVNQVKDDDVVEIELEHI